MSFPGTGDPYTTSEGNTRQGLYAVNSIPNLQVDGGWNNNPGSYNTTLFNQFKAKPSFIKLSANFNLYPGNIKVITKYTPLINYNNSNLRLFVALCEKRTTGNVKNNGETEFFHVLKKMLPNANGIAIGNVTKNVEKLALSEYYVRGSYRLPINGQTANIINLATENTIEDINNLEVVVFIQDIVTKEVYQSANGIFSTTSIDGVDKLESGLTIYPNPSSTGNTNVSFNLINNNKVKLNIYNTLGQIVNTIDTETLNAGLNTININTEALAKGIYTIKIEGENFSKSDKFIVE